MKARMTFLVISLLAVAAAGATLVFGEAPDSGYADTGEEARTVLRDARGKVVGTAILEEGPFGVRIHATFNALPAGVHALHLHETGRCVPPFDTAGGHFNPTGKEHGFLNSHGYHAGDLPNITVPEDQRLSVDLFVPGVALTGGRGALLDADGAALIVHEHVDDYRSTPTGGAGPRVACGVVTTGGAGGAGPVPR